MNNQNTNNVINGWTLFIMNIGTILVIGISIVILGLWLSSSEDYKLKETLVKKVPPTVKTKDVNEKSSIVVVSELGNVIFGMSNDEYEMREYIIKFMLDTNMHIYYDLAWSYTDYFINATNKYNLNINEVIALSYIESHFDRMAKSNAKCIGLMQVNPRIWLPTLIKHDIVKYESDLYDPEKNIMAGSFIFKYYIDEAIEEGYIDDPIAYAVCRYVGTSKKYIKKHYPEFSNHHYFNKWLQALSEFSKIKDEYNEKGGLDISN